MVFWQRERQIGCRAFVGRFRLVDAAGACYAFGRRLKESEVP
jgi:hypothetical protein